MWTSRSTIVGYTPWLVVAVVAAAVVVIPPSLALNFNEVLIHPGRALRNGPRLTSPSSSSPHSTEQFSASLARSMSEVTDLREFVMRFMTDERICSMPALRDIILGKEGSDERGKVWWSRRCRGARGGNILPSMTESTLLRYRRKSSNRGNPTNSIDRSRNNGQDQKKWKKIQKLLKDKRVGCKPKRMAVPLPNTEPHAMELRPACVYIKQCGGCCDSPNLECIPTRNKTRTFPAMALSLGRHRRFRMGEPILMVKVEEHRQCSCECRVRQEHCTEHQVYNQDACQCQCPQESDRSCPQRKVWNEKECRCVCSSPQECTTGRFFDTETCRCLRT